MRQFGRRELLKMSAATGAGLALGRAGVPAAAQETHLSVLGLDQPGPMPAGTGNFALELMETWKTGHDTAVDYDLQPFPEIDAVTRSAFQTGGSGHDLFYNWAMVPEFAPNLVELGSQLPADLLADLAPSQAASVSWQGQQYGVVFSLSLLLLFYNKEVFGALGIDGPPATWDELKRIAAELSATAPAGLIMPYGAAAGIGGVCSIWSAFLQQAGGRMFDEEGKAVFADAPGVDALQLMVDLMPYTTPESVTTAGYNTVAYHMASNGTIGMTFSFPPFWTGLNNGAPVGEGRIVPAVLPSGPQNNASINGVDAWTMARSSPNQALALQLLSFYLSPEVQRRQFTDTGWMPARLSVLADPGVQQANPVAAVLLEQAKSPFDSFVTGNYLTITNLIGMEIQKALAGQQSASQALTAASEAIQPLLAGVSG